MWLISVISRPYVQTRTIGIGFLGSVSVRLWDCNPSVFSCTSFACTLMFNLWYFCLSTEADQDSSGGMSTTQSTLDMMRTSRNGTIRSGTIPSVQMYVLNWLYANLCQLSADQPSFQGRAQSQGKVPGNDEVVGRYHHCSVLQVVN